MHHQKRKKKLPKKHKTSKSLLRSELNSYQPNSPLTKYVEKVCGVNSTDTTKV